MSSEARVHGVLSKAQSRDQPISQSFSQSALDRSDLPCQVMAKRRRLKRRGTTCAGCKSHGLHVGRSRMPRELGSDGLATLV